MGTVKTDHINPKKKHKQVNREYNTALYLLRCTQIGLHYDDLENLTYGMVQDLFIERDNDECEYEYQATQEDFDKF